MLLYFLFFIYSSQLREFLILEIEKNETIFRSHSIELKD